MFSNDREKLKINLVKIFAICVRVDLVVMFSLGILKIFIIITHSGSAEYVVSTHIREKARKTRDLLTHSHYELSIPHFLISPAQILRRVQNEGKNYKWKISRENFQF